MWFFKNQKEKFSFSIGCILIKTNNHRFPSSRQEALPVPLWRPVVIWPEQMLSHGRSKSSGDKGCENCKSEVPWEFREGRDFNFLWILTCCCIITVMSSYNDSQTFLTRANESLHLAVTTARRRHIFKSPDVIFLALSQGYNVLKRYDKLTACGKSTWTLSRKKWKPGPELMGYYWQGK